MRSENILFQDPADNDILSIQYVKALVEMIGFIFILKDPRSEKARAAFL